jgi:subtilisin family serine protease
MTLFRTLLAGTGWVVALTAIAIAADKPKITSQDQLPRFSYPLKGKVTEIVTNDAAYAPLAAAVRADLEKLLATYDIADRTTLQEILNTLMLLDVHAGKFDSALERLATIRSLEEKPANKYTAGLLVESYMAARRSGDFSSEAAFRAAFQKLYASKLAALPWDIVADNVKQAKAGAEVGSEALILGSLESSVQPGVDKTGTVSGDVAQGLLSQRTVVAHLLPLKAERVAALTTYLAANQKVKADIWAARDVSLGGAPQLTPVVVAIWDSGVDMALFPKQRWTNAGEKAVDGKDDDGNGFIDDVHGIGYDLKSKPTSDLLVPLDDQQKAAYPAMRNRTKGFLDLQSNIDSPEASELKRLLSGLKPDDVKPFVESLNFFGNYTHGTHVAGIAAAGNPAARLMAVRITFDFRMIPDVPTREQAEREAAAARATVAYLKQHGVRVVNMSWGGSPRDIEGAFEANGAGGTPEERRKTAREYFQLFRDAMTQAMAEAPEILFVAAAGNSDNDASFAEFVPSGIDLSNILTVGAVDQAGEETSFSSFGKNVDVHANGFEVDSTLPGGERMKYSGTSMASPNVANLAAKLLAVHPGLNVDQVIQLIKLGTDLSPDGRIRAINPKRSFALLEVLRKERKP